MKCHFNTNSVPESYKSRAFTLIETIAALAVLGIVTSSVLVVIDRCMTSTVEAKLQWQAFEVARENMEKLLTAKTVSEMTEFGASEQNPGILWQTTVEAFYEPITSRIWIQAACGASYLDDEGEEQTVEFTHWLTDVTAEQLQKILDRMQNEQAMLEGGAIATFEDAAAYAGVDIEMIEDWVKLGMPITPDGKFIPDYLDLYANTDGEPTPQALQQVGDKNADLINPPEPTDDVTTDPDGEQPEPKPKAPTYPPKPGSGATPQELLDWLRQVMELRGKQ